MYFVMMYPANIDVKHKGINISNDTWLMMPSVRHTQNDKHFVQSKGFIRLMLKNHLNVCTTLLTGYMAAAMNGDNINIHSR
jgi:hypothetical protein